MQYFLYKAIDGSGEVHSGTMAATNIADLDARLGRSGLELLVCKVPLLARMQSLLHFPSRHNPSVRVDGQSASRLALSSKDLIDFTFNLEQLLCAGVPLREALADFGGANNESANSTLRGVTFHLIESIDSGQQLSDACASLPAAFNPLYTSMVKVGEQTGRLADVMRELSILLRWNDETLGRIKRVMIYPAFVSLVLLLVIIFVMTWLVPGLMSFLTSTGGELPWHSHALIAVSDFIVQYWIGLLLVTALVVTTGFVGVRRNDAAALLWQKFSLRFPLIGPVLFHIKLARFCRCAAMMYSSGVSLLDSLKHCELVLDNKFLAGEVSAIRASIAQGQAVSECFSDSVVFPSMIARMVRVGEATGAMDKSFAQISYFYDRQARDSIEKLEQFIGPVLIVIVGLIMLWVVVSVIGPIYDLVFSMGASF